MGALSLPCVDEKGAGHREPRTPSDLILGIGELDLSKGTICMHGAGIRFHL